MTFGIGGAMDFEDEGETVERAQTEREKVQHAYDILSVSNDDDPYWKGYQRGLRDMLEQLV